MGTGRRPDATGRPTNGSSRAPTADELGSTIDASGHYGHAAPRSPVPPSRSDLAAAAAVRHHGAAGPHGVPSTCSTAHGRRPAQRDLRRRADPADRRLSDHAGRSRARPAPTEVALSQQAMDRLGAQLGGTVTSADGARQYTVVGLVEFPSQLEQTLLFAPITGDPPTGFALDNDVVDRRHPGRRHLGAGPAAQPEGPADHRLADVLLHPPPASELITGRAASAACRSRSSRLGTLIAGLGPAGDRAAGRAGVRGQRPPPPAPARAGRGQRRHAGPRAPDRARRRRRARPGRGRRRHRGSASRRVRGPAVHRGSPGPLRGPAATGSSRWRCWRSPRWPWSPACWRRSCRRSSPRRQNVVTSLAGRRGVTRSRKRWLDRSAWSWPRSAPPSWRLRHDPDPDRDHAGRPRLGELGLVLCTPSLVGLIARIGRILPLAPRIALRDAARNRAAAAPAISAVMAAVAGSVALGLYFEAATGPPSEGSTTTSRCRSGTRTIYLDDSGKSASGVDAGPRSDPADLRSRRPRRPCR